MTPSVHTVCGMLASLFVTIAVAWSVIKIAGNSGVRSHSRPVLLLLGDSLTEKGTDPTTQGWVTLLKSRYTRSSVVVTHGLSGVVLKGPLWNGSDAETNVPIGDYKENLIKIVSGLWVAAPTAQLLQITPPHVNDSARVEMAQERTDSKRGFVDRSNAMTKEYALACVDASETLKAPVLDLNSYFNPMSESDRNALLVDGLHFNQEGNRAVDERLRSNIAAEFPTLDNTVWQFPPASTCVLKDPRTAYS
ncbi:hypothetical protein PHYSODRAFT_314019 [Phytophthora sojae]|uniref:SGNH hydrolase-type esterase domain-containing protein n=1 Tax=Phytophthora sojae (strain P6497) TaxID=1094619 RepID=G4Z443_PHYSP|nr:hypothetical protein PHYSODRAFT_314019 [Phytophthora sojae]EGZ22237.1 hypothetical protein PHYSODRAFT_314019 [Phytophthora sojae]|eukprot:XP_009524954.1 hypothetical protein PHYSODRAFT_314019 [Phytophthora sojae]